ncbi:MAG: thymidine phosphorylase, partial [Bacillota bacterium]|nr:thymidine phosphorylase [Bacillota bacterium]
NAIENGSAFDKLCAMVKEEGGDAGYIKDTGLFPKADYIVPVKSEREGYIERMETAEIGRVSVTLGAGRNTVNASVDHSAGIRLCRKTGDYIKKGETIAWLHTNNADAVDESAKRYLAALSFSAEPPELKPLIYAYVNQGGVHLCSDL